MGSLTVTADRIVHQAANTIPGNATGAEAACQSLTPSQVRDFLGMATTSDVTFDIVRATTSVQTPLVNNASAALTLGNATYGVTVPGGASIISQDNIASTGLKVYANNQTQHISIGWSEIATTFGSLRLPASVTLGNSSTSGSNGTLNFAKNDGIGGIRTATLGFNSSFDFGYFDGSNLILGANYAAPANSLYINSSGATICRGDISMSKTSAQGYIRAYATDGVKNFAMYHDGTNGILSTSSGALVLLPSSSVIGIGGITANDPALVKNSNELSIRNGTNSAYATIHAKQFDADYGRLYSPNNVHAVVQALATGYPMVIQGSGNGARIYDGTNSVDIKPVGSDSIAGVYTGYGTVFGVSGPLADWHCAAISCAGITASGIFSLTANYQNLSDGVNVVCGTTTGTKLATGATQKLSFWGVTPVVQPASANQAALSLDSDVTGGDTVDKAAVDANFAAIQTLVNQLRSDLVAAGIIKGAA